MEIMDFYDDGKSFCRMRSNNVLTSVIMEEAAEFE